jgi:NADH dehydrogenase
MSEKNYKHIIIVGGGFAGVRCALDLLRSKTKETKITLISDQNYFEYYPAMYRVVTGSSSARVKIPLVEIFGNRDIDIVLDRVTHVNPEKKQVTGDSGVTYDADYLVMAVGSQMTYFNIEGIEELSFNFRTIDRALDLKRRIHDLFEKHAHGEKSETLVSLHFVIVGGGASGVELAGELALYTRKLAQVCNVPESFITIDLIEAAPRILPALSEKISEHATHRLRSLGVNVLANRTLVKSESWTVFLNDMKLGARTVIWTAGVKNNDLYRTLSDHFEFDGRGRVVVDEYLQAQGFDQVFIAGDNAATQYTGLAQTALHDGSHIANLISDDLRGKKISPYVPQKVSYDIPIGPGWAILQTHGVTLFGRLPWIMRHFIDLKFYLSFLPFLKAIRTFFAGPEQDEVINAQLCRTYDESQ